MSLIKNKGDLPDWFDVNNYDLVKDFDATHWKFELENRRRFYTCPFAHSDPPNGASLYGYTSTIAPDEWTRHQKILAALGSCYEWDHEEIIFTRPINMELVLGRKVADEEYDGAVRDLGIQTKIPGWRTDVDFSQRSSSECFVTVDLMAPDDKIMEDFAHWLKQRRRSLPDRQPKRRQNDRRGLERFSKEGIEGFSESDFSKWHKSSALPYIDLMQWARLNQVRISLPTLGDALFPGSYDEHPGERVRQVTARHAKVMTGTFAGMVMRSQVGHRRNRDQNDHT